MIRITPADIEADKVGVIIGRCPEILTAWAALDRQMRFSGRLSPELKEEVRRALAPGVGCVYCASLGEPADSYSDPRVSLAVAYALLLMDPKSIEDETFEILREEFSEEEIVELTCWSLFMIAGQGVGAAMRISASTAEEAERYKSWRAEGQSASVR